MVIVNQMDFFIGFYFCSLQRYDYYMPLTNNYIKICRTEESGRSKVLDQGRSKCDEPEKG